MKQSKNFLYKEYPVPEKYADFFVRLWEFSVKDDFKGRKWGFVPYHLPLVNIRSEKGEVTVELRGTSTKKAEFPSRADTRLRVFEIQPYLAAPLFGVKCSAMVNSSIPVREVPQVSRDIKEVLYKYEENFESIITSFGNLISELNIEPADTIVHKAVNDFLASKGKLKPGDYIPGLSVGERQFQRRFKNETGISAKDFLKNVRMYSLSSELVKKDFKDSGLPFDFGYFDQPHYNKDFKRFIGCSPLTFRDRLKLIKLDTIS